MPGWKGWKPCRALTMFNYAGGVFLVALGIIVYTNLISTLANYVPIGRLV